ncbi:hypothetical protein LTR53_017795, partial [Teratosphaeriaceae sp. CCFEE 6253]
MDVGKDQGAIAVMGCVDDLSIKVQALPVELQDLIYTFTFTANPVIRYIDDTYKPPGLLQVDRTSRRLFAQSYYCHTTTFECNTYKTLTAWFTFLSCDDQNLVASVRLGPTAEVPLPSIQHSGRAFRKGRETGSFRGFPRGRSWVRNA